MDTDTWTSWNDAFMPEIIQVIVIWEELSPYFSGDFQHHMSNEIESRHQTGR
ncbi:MAG: hypothetical protein V7746_17355 [Halioglobus sp.]